MNEEEIRSLLGWYVVIMSVVSGLLFWGIVGAGGGIMKNYLLIMFILAFTLGYAGSQVFISAVKHIAEDVKCTNNS